MLEAISQVAHLQGIGIGEGDGGEAHITGLAHAQHGQVRLGILDDHVDGEFPPVGQRDAHIGRALDDMPVGEDHPAGIDDDTRTQRPGFPRAALELALAEEAREERVIGEGRNGLLLDAGGIDIDHRGRH